MLISSIKCDRVCTVDSQQILDSNELIYYLAKRRLRPQKYRELKDRRKKEKENTDSCMVPIKSFRCLLLGEVDRRLPEYLKYICVNLTSARNIY